MCVQRCGHVLSAIFIFIFFLFIIYLFNRHITLGIFISGSGAYNQPVKWCGHHFLLSHFFSKSCPDIIYADLPILQKCYHNIVNINE